MLPIFQAQNTQQLQAAGPRLLRNFAELSPAGTPYAGLPIASGQWWGLTGAEIAASAGTGEHGPGLLANDSLDPAADYRLVVRNSTFAAGTLVVEEDGAVEYLGPGTAVYDLYEANLLVAGGPGAIAASFAPAQYTGLLATMAAARSLSALAASYTPPAAGALLPAMVAASALQAIAASYQAPTYTGALSAMAAAPSMPSITALYSNVAYNGVLPTMVAGAAMPSFPQVGYAPAWQRALREYTLLAPVDQIDNLGGFAEKDPDARVTLAFEFKRFTATPAAATVHITVWRGADGNPDAVLEGEPAILGTKVYQRVLGGVHDTDYKLVCMLTDAGGQAYVLTGVLPVRRR
jgi:hypothetical protein